MADLISAAGEALVEMTALAQRATEVSGGINEKYRTAVTASQALEGDQTKLQTGLAALIDKMGENDRLLHDATEHCAGRVDAQMRKVAELTKTIINKQKATRDRLAAVRTGLTGVANDLDATQAQFSSDLSKLRDSLKSQFAAAVTSLHQTEDTLRKKVVTDIHSVRTSVADRSAKFQHSLESTVLTRVDHDAGQFVARVTALAQQLEAALERVHHSTASSSDNHLKKFTSVSATNWKGQSGNVEDDAKHRAAALASTGHQQSNVVDQQTTRLVRSAADFKTTMNTVKNRYLEIEALPGQITTILHQHGH